MRLRLVLPPGWASIPLEDAAERRRAVDAVVARAGLDDGEGARLRRDLRQRVRTSADSAAASGASSLMLSVGGPAPIPASILVTFLPRGLNLEENQPWLTEEGSRVDTATMPAGRVVRRIGRRDVDMDEEISLPTLVVDYWLTAPDGRLVHVAMSSPLVEHEKAMVDLFDAVVEGASWDGAAGG
jgi:hypothetical protein